jgi:hypothetical protein
MNNNTNDIMPLLTKIILNIMAYIITYNPVLAEPLYVLPAVSIAKKIQITFIQYPFQAG